MSINISLLFSDELDGNTNEPIPNVMMTAIYEPSTSNGGGHMNGGATAASILSPDAIVNDDLVVSAPVPAQDPSADLKCLDEPSFEFEAAPQPPPQPPAVKKPSYRVLEDPFEEMNNSKPKVPNYRVLEDPMTTGIYDASTSSEANANAAATASPAMLSNRPMASEVLEGARERFDKFWSKKAPESNPEP